MTTKRFAVMWDQLGLEAIAPVPDDADRTWAHLTNTPEPSYPNIGHWRLRAQHNPQRHYEIYIVSVMSDITQQDLERMFENSPQLAADTVRQRGVCFYSNREDLKRIKII